MDDQVHGLESGSGSVTSSVMGTEASEHIAAAAPAESDNTSGTSRLLTTVKPAFRWGLFVQHLCTVVIVVLVVIVLTFGQDLDFI